MQRAIEEDRRQDRVEPDNLTADDLDYGDRVWYQLTSWRVEATVDNLIRIRSDGTKNAGVEKVTIDDIRPITCRDCQAVVYRQGAACSACSDCGPGGDSE